MSEDDWEGDEELRTKRKLRIYRKGIAFRKVAKPSRRMHFMRLVKSKKVRGSRKLRVRRVKRARSVKRSRAVRARR